MTLAQRADAQLLVYALAPIIDAHLPEPRDDGDLADTLACWLVRRMLREDAALADRLRNARGEVRAVALSPGGDA